MFVLVIKYKYFHVEAIHLPITLPVKYKNIDFMYIKCMHMNINTLMPHTLSSRILSS